MKNGFITDTTFSNIVFYDGMQWITPDTYLLNGTQRQRLLREGRIVSREVRVGDLSRFITAKPINSMLDFDTTPEISIAAITMPLSWIFSLNNHLLKLFVKCGQETDFLRFTKWYEWMIYVILFTIRSLFSIK